MKKNSNSTTDTDIQPEYDFSAGARGQYTRRYERGTNVVVLDPDVAKVFPDAKAVNETLRKLAGISKE